MAQTLTRWNDVIDPDDDALRQAWPEELHSQAVEALLAPMAPASEARPKLESHGDYVLGVLLAPVAVTDEDRVYYQEVDLVLGADRVLTVRKTPMDGTPIHLAGVHALRPEQMSAGMVVYHVVDQVAEAFLKLVDDLQEEIDELEDNVDQWDNERISRRLSDLRHDVLLIRRILTPTVDAVRRVIDGRVQIDGARLFDRDTEIHFSDARDTLLEAAEGLEVARELIADARDYHQAKVANDQNEVTKRLTVIAAIVLPPTFIVGLYGQNFDHIPELHWAQGYGFSWVLILLSTVGQAVYFHRKGWL